ncbi:hypothetical protein [uncultured Psychrobacter sp.]|uniref:hypothetical protein n=1 Tax=uncultured Psychrobacter sp. TaxID=259303 RepID=UPI0030DB2B6B
MNIQIQNNNEDNQFIMIVSANKDTVGSAESIKSILNTYQFYEIQQPPMSREHAELEENTDSILDYLEVDLETRIMFQKYQASDANTDTANQVRALAEMLMAKAEQGEDITFIGTPSYNPDANIVGIYNANPTSNPTLQLSWYNNDFGYYDDATVIEEHVGKVIEDINADGDLVLNDIQAVIIEENDGSNYLMTLEHEQKRAWSNIVGCHIRSLRNTTLHYAIAEYSR